MWQPLQSTGRGTACFLGAASFLGAAAEQVNVSEARAVHPHSGAIPVQPRKRVAPVGEFAALPGCFSVVTPVPQERHACRKAQVQVLLRERHTAQCRVYCPRMLVTVTYIRKLV